LDSSSKAMDSRPQVNCFTRALVKRRSGTRTNEIEPEKFDFTPVMLPSRFVAPEAGTLAEEAHHAPQGLTQDWMEAVWPVAAWWAFTWL
jgi:hypothetical protein